MKEDSVERMINSQLKVRIDVKIPFHLFKKGKNKISFFSKIKRLFLLKF